MEGPGSTSSEASSIRLDALSSAPPHRILLLTGPWSGASHLPALRQALLASLRPAGWTVEMRNLTDLHRQPEGRFILLPSGAWPSELLSNWNDSLGPNDILLYFGVRDNLTIDSTGAVHPGLVPPSLLSDSPALDIHLPDSVVLSGPVGVRIWSLAHTLDEFPDATALASTLASRMTEPSADHLLAHSTQSYSAERPSLLLAIPSSSDSTSSLDGPNTALSNPSSSSVWMRLRLYDSSGHLLKLWDAPLSPADGILSAPAQAQPGQPVSLQIRLRPSLVQTEQVSYELHLYSPDGRLYSRQLLGGATIGPGTPDLSVGPDLSNVSVGFGVSNESPVSSPSLAWVGSWVQRDWPAAGLVHLEVTDQFGRSYAHAVVEVPRYEVQALDGDGFTRRFRLTRDGITINLSSVSVRRDTASTGLELPLSDGIVSVSSDWSAGPHVLHFDVSGAPLDYKWDETPGGSWAVFWRLGLPGLLVALLLYLVLRPHARPAYMLVVPEWPAHQSRRLEWTASQIQSLVARAAARVQAQASAEKKAQSTRSTRRAHGPSPHSRAPVAIQAADLVRTLAHPSSGPALMVSPESAEQALQSLSGTGHLMRWRDFYLLPSQARTPEQVRALALARLLRDQLIEQGLTLCAPPGSSGPWLDSSGRRWLIYQNQSIAMLSRHLPTHLLFADQTERRSFEQILCSDGSPAASRLRLSLQLHRLNLVLIGHL
jgi:hypothetical protein